MTTECYNTLSIERAKGEALTMENLDARDKVKEARAKPAKGLTKVRLREDDLNKAVRIGSTLPNEVRASPLEFLKKNQTFFSWKITDMLGIDPRVISHHLNVDPTYPIR